MSSEYSAVAAKLKAMYSKFLTEKDYEELLSKESVGDVCAYLKNTEGYGDILEDVNERDIHRGVMELTLARDMLDEYVRLYNFADKEIRRLLKFWFMGHEIEFLKREVRYIYTHEHRSADAINQDRFDAFFETHTRINRDIMLRATTLADCVQACADTPYAAVLDRAQSINADFFLMGMMLDAYRYAAIRRESRRYMDTEQLRLFETLEGAKADMLNLMWIYRGKMYYRFESEMIFAYLLPVRYRLNDNIIRQLVNADSAKTLIEAVRTKTRYGGLFDEVENGRFPEENYRRMCYRAAKRIFVNNSESLAAVYAYLNLKEYELDNITTVTEGVRYGISTDIIRSHIGL